MVCLFSICGRHRQSKIIFQQVSSKEQTFLKEILLNINLGKNVMKIKL